MKEKNRVRFLNLGGVGDSICALVSECCAAFRDSVDRAASVGAIAVLEPGGSVRDGESIEAADEHGMALVMNGARCFSHG